MNMTSKTIILGAAGVVVAAAAILFSNRSGTAESSMGRGGNQASRAAGMRLPVIGTILTPQPFDHSIQATGTILAAEEVELRTEASGKVVSLPFREGSKVNKGDLLVKINDADLRAQLMRSRSRLTFALQREERQRKLREINGVSEEQYDEAKNELTSVRAEVALLEAQVQKTEVRAPFDGVVGLRFVSEGSFISSTTLVARLQDVSFVKVDFSVPEKYAPQVRVGMEISFTVEGSSDPFRGTVYAIEPKIDPATRSLRVRGRLKNQHRRLQPRSI